MPSITENARLEAATEILAEFIGYYNAQVFEESERQEPNAGRIEALEQQIDMLLRERRAITPDHRLLINRALYVYGTLLKPMHESLPRM